MRLHAGGAAARPGAPPGPLEDPRHLHLEARDRGDLYLRAERDVKYSLPNVKSVHMTISSPNGETIFDKDLDVSELGTFFGSVKLTDGAALGPYYMNVSFGNQSFSQSFTVAA